MSKSAWITLWISTLGRFRQLAGGNPQGYEKVIPLLFHRVIHKAKVVLLLVFCLY